MSNPYDGYTIPASQFHQFEVPGTTVTGQVTGVRPGTFDGDTRPLLDLRLADGSETTVNCGPINLRRQIVQTVQPLVGDVLTITFDRLEGRSKLFTVTVVQRAAGAPPAAAPTQQPPAQQAAPVEQQAAGFGAGSGGPAPWGAGA